MGLRSLRDRLRNLEREADAEIDVLLCPAKLCGRGFAVHWNTPFEWMAHRWVAETGAETFRGPHPDVRVVEAHEEETGHPAEDLLYKATGENWLAEFTPTRQPDLSD